ncbi:MAG: isomerizing glutamine--fructose-6-phosphate transaminase, partial [Nocardioides sp.]|nr:isomerizing glutamine--fructose-6-phosphate transaminase [Nocardioides sp.]
VELASEFRYRDPILDYSTLVVAISQSGETADTLQAIRHARTQRSKVLAICNTNGSTIPRESDAVIYTHAGPEIGVASTKGFLTQLVACYLLALYVAQVKGTRYGDEITEIIHQLEKMPDHVATVLESAETVYELARTHIDTRSVLFLGRHAGYPVALEGALKLKELAYIHAEGFAAGELKHGPIALIEEGLPVLCVVPPQGRDQLHDKMISGIQEVRARGARTICLAEEGDTSIEPYADVLIRLPRVPVLLQPLVAIVPLQLFACELATAMGHDVDQPRNLAKSVTVD